MQTEGRRPRVIGKCDVAEVGSGAAGRCIGTTHEALGSTRVIGAYMSMGEAVGVAAARAARGGAALRELPMAELRGELGAYRRAGALVGAAR